MEQVMAKYAMKELPAGGYALLRHGEPAAQGHDNAHVEFWGRIEELEHMLASERDSAVAAIVERDSQIEHLERENGRMKHLLSNQIWG